mgnify:FL=1
MENHFGRPRLRAYRGQHDFRIIITVQAKRTRPIAGTTSTHCQPNSRGSVGQRATLVVEPERSLTRDELLEAMLWAIDAIRDLASQGGGRRLKQDPQFRYAMAFLWLRLGEPANQLVRRKLVSRSVADRWGYLCTIRNQLAHERNQDIPYIETQQEVEKSLHGVIREANSLLF